MYFPGLLNIWYEQVEQAFVMHHLITNRFDTFRTQAFTFHDIQTAFYILGIGLAGCIVVFVVEVFIMPTKRKLIRKNQSYHDHKSDNDKNHNNNNNNTHRLGANGMQTKRK